MADKRRGGSDAVKVDSAWHRYVEFEMSKDEQIRVTFIPHQDWTEGPTIRIQKRAYTGRMSPGSEFPVDRARELIAAVSERAISGG